MASVGLRNGEYPIEVAPPPEEKGSFEIGLPPGYIIEDRAHHRMAFGHIAIAL